ncbi:hypothetical protein SY88_14010 [Clostridiales bacterium PH28_bin88]|nr:hypothetical protein SY88_14010 [Clostridiales bacterium PH28_bin88]
MRPEWEPYINAWIENARRQRERNAALAGKAYDQARVMAAVLGKEFGARRVYLFGSLLYPERFREGSDIDLGVEGMDPGVFLRAECRLEELTDFPFDLVDLYEATPSLVKVIRSEGEILYAVSE